MSKIYLKGKGRKSALENQMEREAREIIEANNIDITELDLPKTVDELRDFRNMLSEKYGSKKPAEAPKEEVPIEEPEAPVEETTQEPTTSTEQFEEPQLVETEEVTSSPSTRTFELSDFKPVEVKSPFEDSFPVEDMHKAHSDFPVLERTPAPEEVVQPEVETDSTPNAWEVLKNRNAKANALERIDQPEQAQPVTASPPAQAEEKKVPMSSEARKKANESFARQIAKISTWATESGVKYFSKVKEKDIAKLEEEGLIDRNFQIGGKTVAELLDEHHELIDEMVKVDPQSKNDLIEAIKLVAEDMDVQMSPMANLGMVVVTILITLGQAGLQTKKEFKRHLKKVSDSYVMQKNRIAPMEDEISRLRAENERLQNGSQVSAPAPAQSSFTQPVDMSAQPPVKELSFSGKNSDSTGLNIVRSKPTEIEEDSATIDTLDSDIDEGTVTVVKGGKKVTKRGKNPTGKKS